MDRRLWIIVVLLVTVLCTASAFMGIQYELLENRVASIQSAIREPDGNQVRTADVPPPASHPAPLPKTVAQSDELTLAGF